MSDTIKTVTKHTKSIQERIYTSLTTLECILDQFSKAAILDLFEAVKTNNKSSQNGKLLRKAKYEEPTTIKDKGIERRYSKFSEKSHAILLTDYSRW